MPDTETVEKVEISPDEPRQFGTSLEDIFEKTMPLDDDLIEKDEPIKKEVKSDKKGAKKVEPKKEEKESSPLGLEVPETVFEEPVAEPEKKEEVKEPEPTPLPENIKSEPARKAFQALDQRRIDAEKALKSEREARAKDTEKLAAGDPDAKARIQALEQQLKSYDGLVQKALLQEHPEFQKRYVYPRQQLLEQAKSAFKDAGGDPDQIESALSLRGKSRVDKLDELLSDVTSKTLLGRLERSVDGIDRIDTERELVLKNNSEYLKRLQQNDQVSRHKIFEEHEKRTKTDLQDASTILADQFKIPLFKKSNDPKFSEWNAVIDKIDSTAEHIMLKTDDPKEMAIAAKMASAFPITWKLMLEKHNEVKQLKKKLSDYEDSEPKLGATGKKEASNGSEEEEEDIPIDQAIVAHIRKAQGRG